MDKIEAAKLKVEKAKNQLAEARKAAAKENRRTRDTAIYTLGGCFEALLLDPDTKETALKIWDHYYSKVAPSLYSDRRKQALEDVFDLELPKPTPQHTQDPSGGNHHE